VPGFDDYIFIVDWEQDEAQLFNRYTRHRVCDVEYKGMEGYTFVHLAAHGKKGTLHHFGSVILRSLVGEPNVGESCDHIDMVRNNNKISNLRWASAADQIANQRARDPSIARIIPVMATDSEGDETVYISAEDAAVDLVLADDDRLKTIIDDIHAAIRNKRVFRGFRWSIGPQFGDHVVEWRPIHIDFFGESGHMVSRCGLIKEKHGRITAGYLTASGYRKFSGQRVHRMVAVSYIPEDCDLPFVDHWDGNRSNNHASNLRWVTAAGNLANCTMPNSVPIVQRNTDGTVVAESDSERGGLRALKRVRPGPAWLHNIQYALEGKQDTAYGYIWEFKDKHRKAAAAKVREERLRSERKRKAVIRVDTDGNDIQPPYNSIVNAKSAWPGATKISACCDPSNSRVTTGCYRWRYYHPVACADGAAKKKNKTTKPKPIAHIDLDGNIIPPLHPSQTSAETHLKDQEIKAPNLSRQHLGDGRLIDLFKTNDPTRVHSRIRHATAQEISSQGTSFGPDKRPYASLKQVLMCDMGGKVMRAEPFEAQYDAAQYVQDEGLSIASIDSITSKIAECMNPEKQRKSAFERTWRAP
jgi:hypothetical protein